MSERQAQYEEGYRGRQQRGHRESDRAHGFRRHRGQITGSRQPGCIRQHGGSQ
jgi:hypothetical protein